MKELYDDLRDLVSDRFQITIIDRDGYGRATVSISPCEGNFPWVTFRGKDIKDAFDRAITKLQNPDNDYIALDGDVWKANESSVFDSQHIRLFLREGKE